jgi:hypothetical protein
VAWFERPVEDEDPYLHVDDRLSTSEGKKISRRVEAFIQDYLPRGNQLTDLADQIGRLYADERRRQGSTKRWQRNNITGHALEAALQVIIGRLTGWLPQRAPSLNTLQGFELATRGYHSEPDLVLFSSRDFRLLISTKWTLRKERIGTYLHEAYFYKRRRPDLQVAFVVSEFRTSILHWLSNDPLVDRVYHVCLPAFLNAHEPFPNKESVKVSLLMDSVKSKKYASWIQLSSKVHGLQRLFADIDTLGRTDFQLDPEDEDRNNSFNEEA